MSEDAKNLAVIVAVAICLVFVLWPVPSVADQCGTTAPTTSDITREENNR